MGLNIFLPNLQPVLLSLWWDGNRDISGECSTSLVLSHHKQKFEVADQHYHSSMGQRYRSRTDQSHSSMLQLSFIQKIKENTSLRHEGMPTQKKQRRERESARERDPQPFGSSFYVSPRPGPAVCILGQPECCLFSLRSSLWSPELPLFYFRGLFPSLFLAAAILDSFLLF